MATSSSLQLMHALESVSFEVDDRPRTSGSQPPRKPPPVYKPSADEDVATRSSSDPASASGSAHVSDDAKLREVKTDRIPIQRKGGSDERGKKREALMCFAMGVLVGVFPPIILVRLCAKQWVDSHLPPLDSRFFRYGRSMGLFLLVIFCILVAVLRLR
ncbi:hypothetical protein BWQ96_03794 [Gracilariopsis chorda]|uniref:Uncharacterized protein n=1 Tax=Gracilariopsis chorda TaxID=448386 RepID=A0A2V3IZ45_9FLOR|nr:hypothetical protein BWQ96_03794 [Gracilariopsis chorda]|eukprot:PXF46400.1 hypothetical protein BWQ96_03794 [Gracilariopsis chorda]